MARTHKTAQIKQQMADQTREEEEARTTEGKCRGAPDPSGEVSRDKDWVEEKEGMELSTESGRNEATTDDATVDI
ncbi:hypothetical protein GN244_ATG09508 [Phytophthora infestans]|uniref:Uncharacterized protein n=1 Tax=Phytophthora infestans TaxID=4787 RepID=A0A833S1Y5_PHYIN|nr:hypothetical protein GN244_ATG09508 [Phytophthora infestans]KAF4142502.1 hypothetical protein GN958_ATG08311 [Phytophthora infestans]